MISQQGWLLAWSWPSTYTSGAELASCARLRRALGSQEMQQVGGLRTMARARPVHGWSTASQCLAAWAMSSKLLPP